MIIEDGLFNILLGSVVPIPYELFDEPERFLAIQVEADNEMHPRQRLTSVGYAFQSMNTQLVNIQHLPDNDGIVNQTEDPVSWYKLKDIPVDFADGTDDVGSGGSGITQINGGTGLSVTNSSGPTTTLDLDMRHTNGINADMVDGNHATDFATSSHDHWGAFRIHDTLTNSHALRIHGNIPCNNGVIIAENTNSGPGIWGVNHSSGNGLRGGNSATGIGIYGHAASGAAIVGQSESN